MPREVTCLQTVGYGCGHVLNDAAAITWFSYGLMFFTMVGLDSSTSGLVIFAGQIADAIATPISGVGSDATPEHFPGGRRRVWIAAGAVIVAAIFPLVFSVHIARTPALAVTAGALFNVGWAMTQVSHLSLAPELGQSDQAQLRLSTVRQVATVLSSLGAFALVRLRLSRLGPDPEPFASAAAFHDAALQIIAIGLTSTAVCIALVGNTSHEEGPRAREAAPAGTKEGGQGPPTVTPILGPADIVHRQQAVSPMLGPSELLRRSSMMTDCSVATGPQPAQGPQPGGVFGWLALDTFWVIGALYTCARLSVNLPATYIPLLLLEVHAHTVNGEQLGRPDAPRPTIHLAAHRGCRRGGCRSHPHVPRPGGGRRGR